MLNLEHLSGWGVLVWKKIVQVEAIVIFINHYFMDSIEQVQHSQGILESQAPGAQAVSIFDSAHMERSASVQEIAQHYEAGISVSRYSGISTSDM